MASVILNFENMSSYYCSMHISFFSRPGEDVSSEIFQFDGTGFVELTPSPGRFNRERISILLQFKAFRENA